MAQSLKLVASMCDIYFSTDLRYLSPNTDYFFPRIFFSNERINSMS